MSDVKSLNHSKWECKYHITWIPKCRRKTLYGSLKKYLGNVFRELARQKECKILEGHLMPDHVHMLVAGHADEVVVLGRDLVSTGIRQVEESHDEGETMMEIAACMPVIVKALDKSSLDASDNCGRKRTVMKRVAHGEPNKNTRSILTGFPILSDSYLPTNDHI